MIWWLWFVCAGASLGFWGGIEAESKRRVRYWDKRSSHREEGGVFLQCCICLHRAHEVSPADEQLFGVLHHGVANIGAGDSGSVR